MKLIIHLGLPKTGSTYLQEKIFPNTRKGCYYAGKFLDGGLNQGPLNVARQYLHESNASGAVSKIYRDRFEESIFALDNDVEICLISDEMFALPSAGISWKEKLSRLAFLTSRLDSDVVFFYRDPVEAIYSLYVELYPVLDKLDRVPENFANGSQYSEIYRYADFYRYLQSVFSESTISAFDYRDIFDLRKQQKLLDFFSLTHFLKDEVNVKQKLATGYVTNSFSLREVLGRQARLLGLNKVVPISVWDRGRELLNSFPIKIPGSRRLVPWFSKELSKELAQELKNHTDFMLELEERRH